jgi:hypothetical protein
VDDESDENSDAADDDDKLNMAILSAATELRTEIDGNDDEDDTFGGFKTSTI